MGRNLKVLVCLSLRGRAGSASGGCAMVLRCFHMECAVDTIVVCSSRYSFFMFEVPLGW